MYDLIIIGAGPAGSALALACAKLGLQAALVDARQAGPSPHGQDTRNFAIVRGSWRLLKAIGISQQLAPQRVQPLNGLEATDGGQHFFGAPSMLFGNADLEPDSDESTLGHMVEAEALQAALDAGIAASGQISLFRPALFERFETDGGQIRVTLSTGETLVGAMIAGCDGVNSAVRKAAGIGVETRHYGKSVFAANVRLSRPHDGIARQLFTPEGPFATLPLTGARANLAWYMKQGAAEALAELPTSEIEAELNHRFADFAGQMQIDGPVSAYPLKMQIARAMIADRVALVGDAAHRINPLAGQGLNLGFKDVAALAETLSDAVRAGLDPGSATVLERYSNWRRFDATLTALGMDAIDRVWSNDSALLKPLRGLALAAAGRIGPLRAALARQASAEQPGLPRLMRPAAAEAEPV